jgi:hypothetical protein
MVLMQHTYLLSKKSLCARSAEAILLGFSSDDDNNKSLDKDEKMRE